LPLFKHASDLLVAAILPPISNPFCGNWEGFFLKVNTADSFLLFNH